MIISISSGFENNILIITFFTWLVILIFNIIALVLLCMLHLHYGKVKWSYNLDINQYSIFRKFYIDKMVSIK